MAGRPKRTALVHALEKLTREWAEIHDDEQPEIYDHLDYAESFIASGGTLTQLSDEVTRLAGFDISRDMLKRYLSEGRKQEAAQRLAEARNDGAHGLAEQAIKIVDDAPTHDKEKLAKEKMRAETRLWMAERWNRTDMGKAPDVSVVINHNTLHLDALRKRAVTSVELHKSEQPSMPSRARSLSLTDGSAGMDVIDAVILEEDDES